MTFYRLKQICSHKVRQFHSLIPVQTVTLHEIELPFWIAMLDEISPLRIRRDKRLSFRYTAVWIQADQNIYSLVDSKFHNLFLNTSKIAYRACKVMKQILWKCL